MLDFNFSEEQEMFRRTVKDFARKEIAPALKGLPEEEPFPRDLMKKMADIGLCGMTIPEGYGGQPTDWVTKGIATEEVSKVHFTAGFYLFQLFSVGKILDVLGSEKVKDEWLPLVARGEKLVAMSVTEAAGGSDILAAQTTATKDGNYYIINGEKNSTSWGMQSEAAFVLARTAPRRMTFFLIPLDLPGVTKSVIGDMGYGHIGRSIVSYNNVRIPVENRLGDEGTGFGTFLRTLSKKAES